jgi:hypothetical protein
MVLKVLFTTAPSGVMKIITTTATVAIMTTYSIAEAPSVRLKKKASVE